MKFLAHDNNKAMINKKISSFMLSFWVTARKPKGKKYIYSNFGKVIGIYNTFSLLSLRLYEYDIILTKQAHSLLNVTAH